MPKRILAGGVVIGPQNKILVVNQHGDSWSLPKGCLEAGESEISAAKREIYEESGIKIKNLELIKKLGSYKRYRIGKAGVGEDKTEFRIIHMYLFRTKQTSLSPLDPENPEAKWVEINQVSQLLTHPKDKEFFEKIRKHL